MRGHGTCRCPICGAKNADSNNVRRSYIRVGLLRDENGRESKATSKRESRRLRRTREKRNLTREDFDA